MKGSDVTLYAWQPPEGYGKYSFFVAARSEKEAMEAVEKYISEHLNKNDGYSLTDYEIDGWGTSYYDLRICGIGEVVTNAND